MTTTYHDPHDVGAPVTAAEFNAKLGELDAAIGTAIAAGFVDAATTLDAQAASGQKVLPVVSTVGFIVGDSVWVGTPGSGLQETGVIASISAGVSLTLVANLASTHAIGTPVSRSPAEIVAARGTSATLGDRLDFLGFDMLNAKAYGAVGDGIADDTTALQAFLDAIAATTPTVRGGYIPKGTYKITAALVIPDISFRALLGAGWAITTIVQHTDNVPIFTTAAENISSVEFGDMMLTYDAVQPDANTGAIALRFHSTAAGVGSGWYWWKVRRLHITNANRGIAISPTATGILPVWNCSFDQIRFAQISRSLIWFVSPTVGGMPVSTFRDIVHLTNGGVAPTAAAIEAIGAEMQFTGLDIEDWYNRLIKVGSGVVSINGLHVERHILNSTAPMIEVDTGSLEIAAANYDFTVEGGAAAVLWAVAGGGSLYIRGASLTCGLTSGTITGLTVVSAAATNSIEISGIGGNGIVPFAPGIEPAGTRAVGDAAGVAAMVGGQYYATAFTVKRAVRITTARYEVVTSSGGMDLGIYDEYGNRLGSIGSSSTPAAGLRTSALTASVTLNPGKKYLAVLVVDNSTAVFAYKASATTAHALAAGLASDQAGAAPPLPATIAITATGGGRQFAIDFY